MVPGSLRRAAYDFFSKWNPVPAAAWSKVSRSWYLRSWARSRSSSHNPLFPKGKPGFSCFRILEMGEGDRGLSFQPVRFTNLFSGRNACCPGTSEATPNIVEGSQPPSALVPIFFSSSTPFCVRLAPKASGYPSAFQHACFPWKAV